MRLTSKGRYAVRAMLDLTMHSNGNPVRLQEISTRQNISLHYLEQLFRKLRNGQAVKSVRGPGGGYVLARAMEQISIKDVLDCVGENINPAKDILGSEAETSSTVEFHLSKDYFQNLGTIMSDYLSTTSLGDLAAQAAGVEENIKSNEEVTSSTTHESTVNNYTNTTSNETNSNTSNTSNSDNHSVNVASIIRGPLGEINQ